MKIKKENYVHECFLTLSKERKRKGAKHISAVDVLRCDRTDIVKGDTVTKREEQDFWGSDQFFFRIIFFEHCLHLHLGHLAGAFVQSDLQ